MSPFQMTADQLEVHLGSTVSFSDPSAGREKTFTIVDPHQAKPAEGRLSSISPVGEALLGHKVGDVVEVRTPKGLRRLQIAAIG
ncbi:MAG TPA: GreA/GreB family elongation factor [Solirubrobacteraceae bacterium]|nr:GreA/GreB family elongation factor [Solirubrobacteraceae bacterium]